MPAALAMAYDALPQQAEGEAADVYRARLNQDQRAVSDAFNREVSDGTRWLTICTKGATQ